ncbi:MAG: UDP-glucose 4-epimerase GalE [Phascolarctobacterium sp.]|nr:UDP-glucose 4-epimerase GalE [Candidatus Phascolarctobacterium caballi]
MKILLTGGAGFIGSHTAVELLSSGFEVVVVDNYSNADVSVNDRIIQAAKWQIKNFGEKPKTDNDVLPITFYYGDCRDGVFMDSIFREQEIDAVIHFAGLKAVGESVEKPLEYYDNNIGSTLVLLNVMKDHNIKKLIFSSSATVYSADNQMPLDENSQTGNCTNPYGWTKYMIEQILQGVATADKEWSIVLLRYFNPVGAHASGLIGEEPNGIPNNLMPYICRVAAKKLPKLNVFGNDYPTKDGTGVRDYIHVVDLAKGHVAALSYLYRHNGAEAINLGTGQGYSVLDMLNAFEKVNNVKVSYEITARRAGDVAVVYANPSKAKKELLWEAEMGLEDMVRDAWGYMVKK